MDDQPQHSPLTPDNLALVEQLPLPTAIFTADGLAVAINRSAELYFGINRSNYLGTLIHADPNTGHLARAAFERALAGESFERPGATRDLRAPGTADERAIWYQPTIFPLRNRSGTITHVGYIYRDVTELVEQAGSLETAQRAIEAQESLIQELSSPVVQLWEGVVLVPLVGAIDSRRATLITEELLTAIGNHGAEIVLIDLTGVPIVDTTVANYLLMTASAARLLGAQVTFVGIRSEIAQTLVGLGVDFSQFFSRADLKSGLLWAFTRLGLRVTRA
jgi:anti-anti-sigma regulatory factor